MRRFRRFFSLALACAMALTLVNIPALALRIDVGANGRATAVAETEGTLWFASYDAETGQFKGIVQETADAAENTVLKAFLTGEGSCAPLAPAFSVLVPAAGKTYGGYYDVVCIKSGVTGAVLAGVDYGALRILCDSFTLGETTYPRGLAIPAGKTFTLTGGQTPADGVVVDGTLNCGDGARACTVEATGPITLNGTLNVRASARLEQRADITVKRGATLCVESDGDLFLPNWENNAETSWRLRLGGSLLAYGGLSLGDWSRHVERYVEGDEAWAGAVREALSLRELARRVYDTFSEEERLAGLLTVPETLTADSYANDGWSELFSDSGDDGKDINGFAMLIEKGVIARDTESIEEKRLTISELTGYLNGLDTALYGAGNVPAALTAFIDGLSAQAQESGGVCLFDRAYREWNEGPEGQEITKHDWQGRYDAYFDLVRNNAPQKASTVAAIRVSAVNNEPVVTFDGEAQTLQDGCKISDLSFSGALTLTVDASVADLADGGRLEFDNCSFGGAVNVSVPNETAEQSFRLKLGNCGSPTLNVTAAASDRSETDNALQIFCASDAASTVAVQTPETGGKTASVRLGKEGPVAWTLNGVTVSAASADACFDVSASWENWSDNETPDDRFVTHVTGVGYDRGASDESLARVCAVSGTTGGTIRVSGVTDVSGLTVTGGEPLCLDNGVTSYITLGNKTITVQDGGIAEAFFASAGGTIRVENRNWRFMPVVNGNRVHYAEAFDSGESCALHFKADDVSEFTASAQEYDEHDGLQPLATNAPVTQVEEDGKSRVDVDFADSRDRDNMYGVVLTLTQTQEEQTVATLVYDTVPLEWERELSIREFAEKTVELLARSGWGAVQPEAEYTYQEGNYSTEFDADYDEGGIQYGQARAVLTDVWRKAKGDSTAALPESVKLTDGEGAARNLEDEINRGDADYLLWGLFLDVLPRATVAGDVTITLSGSESKGYAWRLNNDDPVEGSELSGRRFTGAVTVVNDYEPKNPEDDYFGGEFRFRNCDFAGGLTVKRSAKSGFDLQFLDSCSGAVKVEPGADVTDHTESQNGTGHWVSLKGVNSLNVTIATDDVNIEQSDDTQRFGVNGLTVTVERSDRGYSVFGSANWINVSTDNGGTEQGPGPVLTLESEKNWNGMLWLAGYVDVSGVQCGEDGNLILWRHDDEGRTESWLKLGANTLFIPEDIDGDEFDGEQRVETDGGTVVLEGARSWHMHLSVNGEETARPEMRWEWLEGEGKDVLGVVCEGDGKNVTLLQLEENGWNEIDANSVNSLSLDGGERVFLYGDWLTDETKENVGVQLSLTGEKSCTVRYLPVLRGWEAPVNLCDFGYSLLNKLQERGFKALTLGGYTVAQYSAETYDEALYNAVTAKLGSVWKDREWTRGGENSWGGKDRDRVSLGLVVNFLLPVNPTAEDFAELRERYGDPGCDICYGDAMKVLAAVWSAAGKEGELPASIALTIESEQGDQIPKPDEHGICRDEKDCLLDGLTDVLNSADTVAALVGALSGSSERVTVGADLTLSAVTLAGLAESNAALKESAGKYTLTVPEETELVIPKDCTLTVGENVTLKLTDGRRRTAEELDGADILLNDTKNGVVWLNSRWGPVIACAEAGLRIEEDGALTVQSGGALTAGTWSWIDNDGTLTVGGALTLADSKLWLRGDFNEDNTAFTSDEEKGELERSDAPSINNNHVLTVQGGGTLTVGSHVELVNRETLTVEAGAGVTVNQNGMIDSTGEVTAAAGTVTNDGKILSDAHYNNGAFVKQFDGAIVSGEGKVVYCAIVESDAAFAAAAADAGLTQCAIVGGSAINAVNASFDFLMIEEGCTLTVGEGVTLTVPADGVLVNRGTLILAGGTLERLEGASIAGNDPVEQQP